MDEKTRKWLEFVQSSSIPLRQLGESDQPVGIGSGCFLDYLERRFLLSVFHVTRHSSRWVVQIGYNSEMGRIEIYYPGQFNYLAEMKRGIPSIDEVDFSFTEVPKDLTSQFQHWTPTGECLVNRPRTIFSGDDVTKPIEGETYAFAGEVMPEYSLGENALITEHQTYPGLQFAMTKGHYHYFKLPVEHPGHEHFKGCSGAPVIGRNKKVVGLVCGGSTDGNTVWAVNLIKYRQAIDMMYKTLAEFKAQPTP